MDRRSNPFHPVRPRSVGCGRLFLLAAHRYVVCCSVADVCRLSNEIHTVRFLSFVPAFSSFCFPGTVSTILTLFNSLDTQYLEGTNALCEKIVAPVHKDMINITSHRKWEEIK